MWNTAEIVKQVGKIIWQDSVEKFQHHLLDSLVVEYWHRVREVPGSIPIQGPRHTEDVIKMVPVVPLSCLSTEHSKGKYWLFRKINVMDKIWDRKSFEVGGHWPLWRGWKNRMTTQNRQKSRTLKKKKEKQADLKGYDIKKLIDPCSIISLY